MPNAAEKARLAREAAEQERAARRLEKKADRSYKRAMKEPTNPWNVFLVFGIILLALAVGAGAFLIVAMANSLNVTIVKIAGIVFWVTIPLCVACVPFCILHFYIFDYEGVGHAVCAWSDIAAALLTFVMILVFNFSGLRGVENIYYDEGTGLTYVAKDDHSAAIVSYDGRSADIVVPADINGYTVGFIKDGTFRDSAAIHSVTLQGPTSIGGGAFAGCRNLESVTLSENNYLIFGDSFSYCRSLKTFDFGAATIGPVNKHSMEEMPFFKTNPTFYIEGGTIKEEGCKWLDSLSERTIHVGPKTFLDMYTVFGTMVFKDGFTFAGSYIVSIETNWGDYSHPVAKNIYLPASVTSIPAGLFGDSTPDNADWRPQVYFAGTQEQWNAITIEARDNGLWTSGKVDLHVNTPYTEPAA